MKIVARGFRGRSITSQNQGRAPYVLSIAQEVNKKFNSTIFMEGGGQHLEQPNVERPLFRNSKISNIKRTKDELFDLFIVEFYIYFYICLNYSYTQNT